MSNELRMVAVSVLSIALWELCCLAVRKHFRLEYYKRESDAVVIKVNVMPWDIKGKRHFEEQGYSRKFPL